MSFRRENPMLHARSFAREVRPADRFPATEIGAGFLAFLHRDGETAVDPGSRGIGRLTR